MNAFEKDLDFLNGKIEEKKLIKNELVEKRKNLESQFVETNFLIHENSKKINKLYFIKKENKAKSKNIEELRKIRNILLVLTLLLFCIFKPFSALSVVSSLLGITFVSMCNGKINKNKELINFGLNNKQINKKVNLLMNKKETIELRLQMIKEDIRKCNIDLKDIENEIINLNNSYNEILGIYETVLEELSVGENKSARKNEINLEHSKSLQLIIDKIDSKNMFKK